MIDMPTHYHRFESRKKGERVGDVPEEEGMRCVSIHHDADMCSVVIGSSIL